MPIKMQMVIPKGNITPVSLPRSQPSSVNVTPNPPTALNKSMIARIHLAKSGCGSCGRK